LVSPLGDRRQVPTPNTLDGNPPRSLEGIRKLFAGARKGRTAPNNLREWVHAEMWPTPLSRDYKGAANIEKQFEKGRNPLTNNLPDAVACVEGSNQCLNPNWVEWIMGFPQYWTVSDNNILRELNPKKKKIGKVYWEKNLNSKLSSEMWKKDPSEENLIPRTTSESAQRTDRIKRLGNAVVPLQAHVAFALLLGFVLAEDTIF